MGVSQGAGEPFPSHMRPNTEVLILLSPFSLVLSLGMIKECFAVCVEGAHIRDVLLRVTQPIGSMVSAQAQGASSRLPCISSNSSSSKVRAAQIGVGKTIDYCVFSPSVVQSSVKQTTVINIMVTRVIRCNPKDLIKQALMYD